MINPQIRILRTEINARDQRRRVCSLKRVNPEIWDQHNLVVAGKRLKEWVEVLPDDSRGVVGWMIGVAIQELVPSDVSAGSIL